MYVFQNSATPAAFGHLSRLVVHAPWITEREVSDGIHKCKMYVTISSDVNI